jgi:sulfoxide reductase heme-binding subunit YedZ
MSETTNLMIWQFIRAAGLLSYAMLSVSVFMGIALKTRFFDGFLRRPWVFEAHKSITLAALGLMATHLLLVMVDTFVNIGPVGALVPFASSWRPVPAALGTLAFYLAAALVASSYLQRHIGYRAWRAFHYAGFGAWALALVHGFTAGSDTGLAGVQIMYWVTAGAVVFMTAYRMMLPSPVKRPSQSEMEGATS